MRALFTLYQLLTKKRKQQFFGILVISIVGASTEFLSIGAIVPLLASILNPDKLFIYPSVRYISGLFEVVNSTQFSRLAALIFCFCVLITFVIRIILLWAVGKFSFSLGAELSTRMFTLSLLQPYESQIAINSSEKISTILVKSDALIYYAISPAIVILSNSILLLGIILIFYQIQPVISLVLFLILAIVVALLVGIVRLRLGKYSIIVSKNTNKILQILQESFGGIRDIILDGTQTFFIANFRKSCEHLRDTQKSITFISQCPRYVIEFIAMIGIGYSIWSLSGEPDKLLEISPMIGGFVLGFQKIFPLSMQLYSSITTIKGGSSSVNDALDLLSLNPIIHHKNSHKEISFNREIFLSNISFKYPNSDRIALKNVTFEIKKGARIGIIGSSGSGKSTLVDLIMGLIIPNGGIIKIDDRELNGHNLRGWQNQIAHVPQAIFLADVSVAQNIAFGVNEDEIDMNRVIDAARTAKISQFIENLQDGYNARFGERGALVSGGQRQRIGIARALYKNAKLIILDEATSALDSQTEADIIRDILNLDDDLTILMISHRESSLSGFEKIIQISEGQLL